MNKLEQLLQNVEQHIADIETNGVQDVETEVKQILQHIYALHKEYALFREMNG
jgi:BMFP domain-containing protein YqiC